MADNKPRRRQAPEPRHPLLGAAPTLRLMRTATMGGPTAPRQQDGGGGLLGMLGLGSTDEAIPQRLEPKVRPPALHRLCCRQRWGGLGGWLGWGGGVGWVGGGGSGARASACLLPPLLACASPTPPPAPRCPPLLPQTFLASERTFLSWMHMAITLGSIAAALLAFAAGSKKSKSPMHTVGAGPGSAPQGPGDAGGARFAGGAHPGGLPAWRVASQKPLAVR